MKANNGVMLLAVCLLSYSQCAFPLGLGDARVQSFIGQPLEMRIDLLTSPGDDLGSITARLASAEDFAMIGASREAISMPLNFSVREARGSTGPHILVTSRLAVNDPVLRLVVEVNWSSGRLLREYTVFLDPPTVPARAPEPASALTEPQPITQAAARPEPVEPPPQPEVAADEAQVTTPPPPEANQVDAPLAERDAEPPSAEATRDGGEYGPVRSGETLWAIASDYIGQADMDMNQVMLAIQRRNPDAFVNENINLLKRGATLELPSPSEVTELSRERAREMVAQQEAAFRMRSSLAGSSTPLLAAESRSDATESVPAADTGQAAEESASRLEIVPASPEDLAGQPGTGAVPGGEGSEEIDRNLREELARTEEELFSERQQNEYLRERIDELEAQLAETEGASEGLVTDEEMASLEDRLQAERLAEAEDAVEQSPAVEAAAESPGAIPSVSTSEPAGDERPWYSGAMIWIIMSVIVLAGVIGWIINRRRGEEYDLSAMAEGGTVATGLRGEAEEILRTLDADREAQEEASSANADLREETEGGRERDRQEPDEEDEPQQPDPQTDVDEDDRPVVPLERARRYREDDTADARVLDENSSDPEIKLDLARAYISMGDKEAARAILDEVLSTGNEEQCAEARSMMDEL